MAKTFSCANCPFYSEIPGDPIGYCHHDSIGTTEIGRDWWCHHHPLAPGQRDRIAEMIAQGMAYGMAKSWTPGRLAEDAYKIADALLAERAKGKP